LKTTTPKKNILVKKETCEPKTYLVLLLGWLTVCVTGAGAGVENAWEQEKLKARKMLENSYSPQRPVHAMLDELL